jgi:hypothetical protein
MAMPFYLGKNSPMRLTHLFILLTSMHFAAPPSPQQCKDFVKKELPAIAGWCSPKKAEAMMDLVFATLPETCVEMGVFGGSSLFPTACALKYLNHGVVYGIDAWHPGVAIRYYPLNSVHRYWWAQQNLDLHYQNCLSLIRKHRLDPFCVLFKETFASALSKIVSIDILHIDATHTNEGDFIDAIPYIRKVKKMGYIWFDGWPNSPDTYEYLKPRCRIQKVLDSGNCILLQKFVED